MVAEDEVLLVDGTARLTGPDGTLILSAEQIRVEVDAGEITGARLVGVVDADTWARVDAGPLFRLDHDLRGPGSVRQAVEVRLELSLDGDQLEGVIGADDLWVCLQGGTGPVSATEAWLAVAARPADDDDPFAGFVTSWAAEEQTLAGTHPVALSPLEAAALAAFVAGGWRPTRWPGSPRQLMADDLGDDLDLVVVAQALDEDATLPVVVQLPGRASDPLELVRASAALASSLGAEVEVNSGDGTVTLVNVVEAAAGPPAPAVVLDALEATVAAARTAYAALSVHLR